MKRGRGMNERDERSRTKDVIFVTGQCADWIPRFWERKKKHKKRKSENCPLVNVDTSDNEAAADKIKKYRADYNNNTPHAISFNPAIPSTSTRLHSEFVFLLFLQVHRETDRFFTGVHLVQHHRDQFHYRRVVFSSQIKSQIGNILAKVTSLQIILNIDYPPVSSRSHTHPSHSKTSCLLTSSLSLGVPVPRSTQCMWDV